jgi:polyisoprenoid-binding protein YceI
MVRHLMLTKVRGSFTDVSGEIVIAEDPTASSVTVTMQANSIISGHEQRDGHLRGSEFLEIEKYPTLEFRSTGVTAVDGNEFKLNGELTIKGISRPVTLDVEFDGTARSPYGQDVFAFSATTEIDREDWGITYNMALEAGGVLISKNVKIEIEGEAIRQA